MTRNFKNVRILICLIYFITSCDEVCFLLHGSGLSSAMAGDVLSVFL